MGDIILKSPIIRMKDILPFMVGILINQQVMKELMSFDLREKGSNYQVPVFYGLGEEDQQTPIELEKQYFHEIKAPVKKLYVIEKAGHLAMIDNVIEYRKVICKIVNQMAGQ